MSRNWLTGGIETISVTTFLPTTITVKSLELRLSSLKLWAQSKAKLL